MTLLCGSCGHENREGRKFCAECGLSLSGLTCPACGAVNEPAEKFCGDCGAALKAGTVATSAAVTPSQEPYGPEGERKQLTALFADVAGSMEIQERLDPEVWAGIMGRFVSILNEGVRRYGGTVDKFTGDGIMALFGAPAAQEDHARRACHAAWHLTKEIAAYAEEVRRLQGLDLHVRLGLNSGEVVVGRVGDDLRLDPTALGHTVGLAQRMEALAEPGRAYLTEHTARLVEGWFRLVDLGPTPVKGVREPLGVFVLDGPGRLPQASGRALGTAPLVGRARELDVLEDALAAAGDGHAQVVGVVGEAGVGKSRLCEEFAARAAARGITVRRTAGVSHGKDLPLIPILAFLRDYFGITDADDPDQARARISGRLLALDPALDETLPLLFDFLEVPDAERSAAQMSPELRMRRIFDALRRVTERRSEQEVFLLVAEDLQWFDPQSEAFFERIIESYPGSRTLVVTNFRPGFSAPWMRHSYYRQLPLFPLPEEGVRALVGGLLRAEGSMVPLVGFVVERTGGNPFFVEEVVRALVEDGTLAREADGYRLSRPPGDLKVPASVQAVLAARIDRLAPRHKEVLQTAAVVGRVFPEQVLARATGLPVETLEEALDVLCAAELFQEAQRHPVVEYRFWHSLTQEVAYGSLLSERRARLHAAVADAWVAADPARHDERATLIASHYTRAGNHLEAARWEERAATWGQRTDLTDSARRWRAVLTHLEDEEGEDCTRLGIRARLQLLRAGARTGMSHDETEVLYGQAMDMAERLGDQSLLVMVLYSRGVALYVRGELRLGQENWLEAARLASTVPDEGLRAAAYDAGVIGAAYVGPVDVGLHYAELSERATGGDPAFGAGVFGYSPLVRTVHFRAEVLAVAGRLDEARAEAERALHLARERSEMFTVGWAILLLARLPGLTGGPPLDPALLREAAALADDRGDLIVRAVSLQTLGISQLDGGDPTSAKKTFERALAESREQGIAFTETTLLVRLAQAELAGKDLGAARAIADEAVAVARAQGATVVECLTLLTRAEVRRAAGDPADEVLADLDAGFALATDTGARTYEAFLSESLARVTGGEEALRRAWELFRTIGAHGHARRLEAELA